MDIVGLLLCSSTVNETFKSITLLPSLMQESLGGDYGPISTHGGDIVAELRRCVKAEVVVLGSRP